jgi:hypothetical protein
MLRIRQNLRILQTMLILFLRRAALVLFVSTLAVPTSFAQKGVKGGIEVGLRIGPNFNFLTGVLPKEPEFRKGTVSVQPRFAVGVSGAYIFKKYIGIETGVYFNQVAFRVSSQADLDSFGLQKTGQTLDYTLNYIQLPLFFRYNYPINKSLVLQFSAGPRFGFLVTANRNRKYANADSAAARGLPSGNQNVYQNIEFFDVAAAASAQIYYSITDKVYVGGGLRLEYSFTRVFSEIVVNNTQRISGGGNMATLHLQAGVMFRL